MPATKKELKKDEKTLQAKLVKWNKAMCRYKVVDKTSGRKRLCRSLKAHDSTMYCARHRDLVSVEEWKNKHTKPLLKSSDTYELLQQEQWGTREAYVPVLNKHGYVRWEPYNIASFRDLVCGDPNRYRSSHYNRLLIYVQTRGRAVNQASKSLKKPANTLVVIAGFIQYWADFKISRPSSEIYIDLMCVSPYFRNAKLGKKLYDIFEKSSIVLSKNQYPGKGLTVYLESVYDITDAYADEIGKDMNAFVKRLQKDKEKLVDILEGSIKFWAKLGFRVTDVEGTSVYMHKTLLEPTEEYKLRSVETRKQPQQPKPKAFSPTSESDEFDDPTFLLPPVDFSEDREVIVYKY